MCAAMSWLKVEIHTHKNYHKKKKVIEMAIQQTWNPLEPTEEWGILVCS